MVNMFTLAFWKGAAERAIKTFAQVLVGYFVVGTTGLIGFDWSTSLSVAGAATVASLLTSIGNADFTAGKTVNVQLDASLVDERIKEVQADYEAKHLAE